MDEGGPTKEQSGKAVLRHIGPKSPKPIIIIIIRTRVPFVDFGQCVEGKNSSTVTNLRREMVERFWNGNVDICINWEEYR